MATASGVCLWKVFPVQECSHRKGSETAVSRKKCKGGLHPEGTYADAVSSGVCFSLLSARES